MTVLVEPREDSCSEKAGTGDVEMRREATKG